MSENLILKKEVFEEELILHKNAIKKLGKILKTERNLLTQKQMNDLFCPVMRSGKELALAWSKLKCEKTGAYHSLQFHHMIGRNNKKIMVFHKYATQRHYYKNIVILSQKHHKGNSSEELVISPEFIEMVRKKYFK